MGARDRADARGVRFPHPNRTRELKNHGTARCQRDRTRLIQDGCLFGEVPAIHHHVAAGHEGSLLAGEERHGGSYFFGTALAVQQMQS
jgi:hypothetical protein